MALGVNPNSGNNNYWQLYARDPQVRQGAQQKFGVGGQSFGGQSPTGAAGFQALYEQFNQLDARALTGNVGGAKGATEVAASPVTETKGVSNPLEVTQTAGAGKIERPGDKDGLFQGELNPVVANNEIATKLQYFA